jgi:hypothetical protein
MPEPRLATSHFYRLTGHATGLTPTCSVPVEYYHLARVLRLALAKDEIPVLCYALLPRTWHLIVGPTDPQELDAWWSGTGLTHRHHRTAIGGSDHAALVQNCREVERLALEAGLVRRAQDWPWSSLADRRGESSLLPLVVAPFLATRSWVDFVNGPGAGGSVHLAEHPRRFA